MKFLKRIFGLVIILLVIAVFARNFIVKIGAEQAVKKLTGLPLKIEGLSIGLKDTNVDIDDLRLYNPSNFPEKLMANVPDIYIDYNLPDIIKGNIHLNEIRFHLNEFVVVKNKSGQTNLDSLKALQPAKKEGAPKKKEEPSEQKKVDVKIDNLSLRIDRVVYKDYSVGNEPKIQTYEVNLNESYKNIENLNAVVSLIVFKALFKTPIAALSGFDLNGITGELTDTLKTSTKMATDAVKDAKGILNNTTGNLKETTENLKGTADNLKDKAKSLKGLFNKE
ncbi:MAG: hypothetical protein AB7S78_10930 [Candidatus Omnitrophota bacterium]